MVLSLAHVFPVDDILMPKNAGVMCVLLYVYDIVHLFGCNKQLCRLNCVSFILN
jgi:hypothetical protein